MYKISIKPHSSFTSMLHSDTLFGAFCWNYVYLYGEDDLREDILNPCIKGNPSIVFSNGFPHGTVPLPTGIRDKENDIEYIQRKESRKTAYEKYKKFKNVGLIYLEDFKKIQQGCTFGFSKGLFSKGAFTVTSALKNCVDRDGGMTASSESGGNLYVGSEYFADPDMEYDIYLYTTLHLTKVKATIRNMFLLGIGGEKSSGKGIFKIVNELEKCHDFDMDQNINGFMTLSNMIPAQNDPTEGFYKTFVKYGKMDREFAAIGNPLKKPLLFLKCGAIFKTNHTKAIYGRCLQEVSIRQGVIVSGYSLAIPMCIDF